MKAKPIAMKCTQEQFESIKPKLESNKELTFDMSNNFDINKWLINNFGEELGMIGNNNCSNGEIYEREIHETWNERIFLEACGIEVEETYQITKTQILKLHKNEGSKYAQEWYPSVFEEDKKELVVGKWYKTPYCKGSLFCVTDIDNLENKHISGYGTEIGFGWQGLKKNYWWIDKGVTEATPQEIQQALEKEARKRYKVGCKVNCLESDMNYLLSGNNVLGNKGVSYFDGINKVWMNVNDSRNACVFDNGIWAKIIKQMTQQQIEKELGYEISII